MTDLNIDEKKLKDVAECVDHLMVHFKGEIKNMLDKDNDVFCRYMAYVRLMGFISIYKDIDMANRNTFRFGFDLNKKIFHTDEFKDKGWSNSSLKDNPFFKNEDKDDEDEEVDCVVKSVEIKSSDLSDEAKNLLASILERAIKKKNR